MASKKKKEILIKCTGADAVPVQELNDFQGDLKVLSDENYKKFKKELLTHGFSEPISVWVEPETNKKYILNGHQRRKTVLTLLDEGYSVPDLPINYVEADDIKQAKMKVLSLTSQWGEMTNDSLEKFCKENELIFSELIKDLRFPELLLNNEAESKAVDSEAQEKYTNKIDTPIYQTNEEKPSLKDLINVEKTEKLIKEIEEKVTDKEIKSFLILAAYRHIVFNYSKIADFYCHMDKDVQELMENSALVIIDFNKAIENGYVQLREDLVEGYLNNEE